MAPPKLLRMFTLAIDEIVVWNVKLPFPALDIVPNEVLFAAFSTVIVAWGFEPVAVTLSR